MQLRFTPKNAKNRRFSGRTCSSVDFEIPHSGIMVVRVKRSYIESIEEPRRLLWLLFFYECKQTFASYRPIRHFSQEICVMISAETEETA